MVKKQKKNKSIEEIFDHLDLIISNLESGDISLEESLNLYEEGMKLSAICKSQLDKAEQRVKELSNNIKDIK
tara:strand:+ start:161 stop:376 length:216 start_codon:yes stop_codon:yes gene_type:complete